VTRDQVLCVSWSCSRDQLWIHGYLMDAILTMPFCFRLDYGPRNDALPRMLSRPNRSHRRLISPDGSQSSQELGERPMNCRPSR
jgi:hypothetical protein